MNGHQPHPGADEEQPTERTALLGRYSARAGRGDRREGEEGEGGCPPVEPVVARLQEGIAADCAWCPEEVPEAERPAYIVVALLQLRQTLAQQAGPQEDTWEQWLGEQTRTSVMESAEKQIAHTWMQFLSAAHTSEEVQDFLWTAFPLREGDVVTVRVVDFLGLSCSPEELISHRIVLLSLLDVWKHGRRRSLREVSMVNRLLLNLDAFCSPRVLHLLDLMLYLGYVAILAHYALLPPYRSTEADVSEPSIRATLLMIYASTRLCQPWTIFTGPFVLTLLAFLVTLPLPPSAEDASYGVILLALSLHILQLQLPYPPGPLHLFPPDQALPVAILIWHGVSRVFLPVVLFFLPALVLALFLLSTSLSDTLFQPFVLLTLIPSPMEARTVFLVLFSLLFILLLCSLLVLALVYPSVTFGPSVASPWDRYSRTIGIEARRNFARTVILYSTPYKFVPPFNILELAFLQLPAAILRVVGQKRKEFWLAVPRRILWRTVVGPFGLLLAGFWLWGFSF